MLVAEVSVRRKGLAAVTLAPPPAETIERAEYEGERLLLDRTMLARCGVEKGSQLSFAELKDLVFVSECYRAKQRAVWYLSRSDHSKKALLDKLGRTFSEGACAFAVSQMEQKGYVCDARYAEYLAKKLAAQNVSGRAAYSKMLQKGVPAQLARETLGQVDAPEAEMICALLKSKYKNKLQNEDDCRRTVLSLQRRGFRFGDIRAAMQGLLDDCNEETE